LKNRFVWINVWLIGGNFIINSVDERLQSNIIKIRFDVDDSINIIKKKIALVVDKIDPVEDITFHEENASGKSEYRRGIPFKPRKCCGKNVIFTLKNIAQNWAFIKFTFKGKLNRIGNQWVVPAKIANTAPIDKT